jgi:hypothetical protein
MVEVLYIYENRIMKPIEIVKKKKKKKVREEIRKSNGGEFLKVHYIACMKLLQ